MTSTLGFTAVTPSGPLRSFPPEGLVSSFGTAVRN